MKAKLIVVALAVLCGGCMTAKTSRTNADGSVDSLNVHAFLFKIGQGTYTSGNGLSMTVTDAAPDQQTISILAGSVVELSKVAVMASRAPTNTAGSVVIPKLPSGANGFYLPEWTNGFLVTPALAPAK